MTKPKKQFSHGASITKGSHWLCGRITAEQEEWLGHAKFGRMFPHAVEFTFHPKFLEELADTMTKPKADGKNIPAGFVFLGQFIDHDITLDTTSSFERRNDPNMLINFRTPALELDNVYGLGNEVTRYLYTRDANNELTLMLLGKDGKDLPRNTDGTALIGDFRNDENFFIANLQLAFLRFHNAVVDELEADKDFRKKAVEELGLDDTLELAQRLVRWHYQWIVVHEYLPHIIGRNRVNNMLRRGLRFYRPTQFGGHSVNTLNPFIPVEFSVAAFRFGHSQVNELLPDGDGKERCLFPIEGKDDFGPGFTPLSDLGIKIAWDKLFDIDGSNPIMADNIDTRLVPALLDLPEEVVDTGIKSLARRNLLRGNAFGLPSGETVAELTNRAPLTVEELGTDICDLFEKYDMPVRDGKTQTPLWYYILREAEVKRNGGRRLGPVGGLIVGEVLLGLLLYDPQSYLSLNPNWMPTLGDTEGDFTMADLIKIAELDEDGKKSKRKHKKK